jgi:hypothetical protein
MITRATLSSVVQGLPKYRSMLAGNTAFDPGAFVSIASASGNGVSSVTFSSIPATYASLQIRFTGRLATQTGGSFYNTNLRLNSDTGANYTWHGIRGTGSSIIGYGSTGATYFDIEETMPDSTITANVFSGAIVDIHNYASSTQNKTVRAFHGTDANGSGAIWLSSSLWLNTNAINSITLYTNATGNFANGTQFSLYGIKGA